MTAERRYISPIARCIVLLTFALTLIACHSTFNNGVNDDKKLSIDYEKHVLDNGLTVLIHKDHSDPVVHVDVTYHVGSAREELGKSGFAHLFEHMMFQGSENVADEVHIKTVTETGGRMNGTTNRDRTNYFQTVPANHLETMLWLEADRMGFFLEGITQEKFEVQRATVKNEKQQNYDNRAYGRAFELITKALYPYGHPYSWLTIGDLEDLDRATAEDLRNFFLYWYGPNNATLTIGGDVEPERVLALVEKYFGGIAPGPGVEPLKIDSFNLSEDRYVSYYDDKIRFPAVTFSYPTVPKFHPDAPALACLAGILGSGKSSYLYQNFIKTQRAINANASHNADELAGEFFMFVLPYPGKSLNAFEADLRASFDEFEKNGVSDEDLTKFKARYETGFINGLETVSGKVSKLAYYETFANDPGRFNEELQAYLSVTKEDVMRVYQTYIKNKPAVILSILADPEGEPAKPDNYQIPTSGDSPYPKTNYSNLSYKKAEDDFDRSVKPKPQAAKLAQPPEYWEAESENGMRIIGAELDELPKISFTIKLKGGYELDLANAEKRGIASLTTQMMNTSTVNYSEEDISEALELLGSNISFSTSNNYFIIRVSSLSKHLDETLLLLEEKLFKPAFLDEDFKRIQKQLIESLEASTKQASSIVNIVWNRIIYGDKHPRGVPPTHVIPTVSNVTAEDVRTFYQTNYSPADAEVVVVGDISKSDALAKLNTIFAWQAPAPVLVAQPAYPKNPNSNILYFVDKPGAAQSEIRIGYMGDLPFDATGEYFKRYLMNFPLGGAFNSRINLNLREEKGLSYGAGTRFSGSEEPGPFMAYASVKRDGTALAVSEIMREISEMRSDGITAEELQFMQDAIGQRDALSYESSSQKAGFLAQILRFNMPEGFVEERKRIVASITKEEIDTVAKKHLPANSMQIIVVGDKASIFEDMEKLGYPIVELSVDGGAVLTTAPHRGE